MNISLKRIIIGALALYIALQWYSIYLITNLGIITSEITAQSLFWSLKILGKEPTVNGSWVIADSTRFGIIPECTITAPLMVLIIGALITPVHMKKKLYIIVIAFFLLSLINMIRLTSLFFLLSFNTQYFDMIHVLIWQPMMIISAIFIWGCWIFRENSL